MLNVMMASFAGAQKAKRLMTKGTLTAHLFVRLSKKSENVRLLQYVML